MKQDQPEITAANAAVAGINPQPLRGRQRWRRYLREAQTSEITPIDRRIAHADQLGQHIARNTVCELQCLHGAPSPLPGVSWGAASSTPTDTHAVEALLAAPAAGRAPR